MNIGPINSTFRFPENQEGKEAHADTSKQTVPLEAALDLKSDVHMASESKDEKKSASAVHTLGSLPTYSLAQKLQGYFLLEDIPQDARYIIGSPAVNSSGDFFHILPYLTIAQKLGYCTPIVLLAHNNKGSERQASITSNFAKLCGFSTNFIKKQEIKSGDRANSRVFQLRNWASKMPETCYLIDQKATTLFLSHFILKRGFKNVTDFFRQTLKERISNQSKKKNFADTLAKIESWAQKTFLAIKEAAAGLPILLLNRRVAYASTNDKQDLDKASWSHIEQAVKSKKIFTWYLVADSKSSSIKRNETLLFEQNLPKDLDTKGFFKLGHVWLLMKLLELPNLLGMAGNTSGTLDIAALLGYRVFSFHNFSRQEYRRVIMLSNSEVPPQTSPKKGTWKTDAIYLQEKEGTIKAWRYSRNRSRAECKNFNKSNQKIEGMPSFPPSGEVELEEKDDLPSKILKSAYKSISYLDSQDYRILMQHPFLSIGLPPPKEGVFPADEELTHFSKWLSCISEKQEECLSFPFPHLPGRTIKRDFRDFCKNERIPFSGATTWRKEEDKRDFSTWHPVYIEGSEFLVRFKIYNDMDRQVVQKFEKSPPSFQTPKKDKFESKRNFESSSSNSSSSSSSNSRLLADSLNSPFSISSASSSFANLSLNLTPSSKGEDLVKLAKTNLDENKRKQLILNTIKEKINYLNEALNLADLIKGEIERNQEWISYFEDVYLITMNFYNLKLDPHIAENQSEEHKALLMSFKNFFSKFVPIIQDTYVRKSRLDEFFNSLISNF